MGRGSVSRDGKVDGSGRVAGGAPLKRRDAEKGERFRVHGPGPERAFADGGNRRTDALPLWHREGESALNVVGFTGICGPLNVHDAQVYVEGRNANGLTRARFKQGKRVTDVAVTLEEGRIESAA